ncbi:MAG: type II toxin-antitoxin system RelE/ParE family toxin [Candidatus Babeliales bacterium]
MIYIKESDDYLAWLNSLTKKEQAKVKARISRIEQNEYFGTVRNLGEGLAELKWTNGWRVYFANIGHKKILLINGGHKNEQEKDIKKARIYLRRITTS